jgi:DNA-binding transcriptional MerR regulator
VSIRMLRHYDEIGLLQPSSRSISGYREYNDEDVSRLQHIVSLRSTGMGLTDIAVHLASTTESKLEALESQANLLRTNIEILQQQLDSVDKNRRATLMGLTLTPEEIFEVFGEHDPTQHADETFERWGDTDSYKESQRRTSNYSKDDWASIQNDAQRHLDAFKDAMQAALAPDSEEAMAAAELHRLHIDTWFYPCSYEMQMGLADMYIADERFAEFYNNINPDMAQYVHAAILANALTNLD